MGIMDLVETTTHSFIVKIWLEESVADTGRATWRGHITHVPSRERRYFDDLNDITLVIAPYLEAMSVKARLSLRMRQRIGRWFPFTDKRRR